MQNSKIYKGINYNNITWSIGLIAFGILLAIMGRFFRYTLAIGNLALPGWSVLLLALASIIAGILLISASLKAKKCKDCNKSLKSKSVKFNNEFEPIIVESVSTPNANLLSGSYLTGDPDDYIELTVDYCPNCLKVAEIELEKTVKYNTSLLKPKKEILGEEAEGFAEFVEKFDKS